MFSSSSWDAREATCSSEEAERLEKDVKVAVGMAIGGVLGGEEADVTIEGRGPAARGRAEVEASPDEEEGGRIGAGTPHFDL